MKQLVWKEFFLQRKLLLLYMILPIYGALKNPEESFTIAIIYFFTCSLMIFVSLYQEDKNKTDRVLASLPLKRRQIVIGKYMAYILFVLYGFIVSSILLVCIQMLFYNEIYMPLYAVFLGVSLAVLYVSFILPVTVDGNQQFVMIVNAFMVIPMISLLAFMSNILSDPRLTLMIFKTENVTFIITVLFLVALVVYMLSMIISIVAFEHKEL